MVVVPAWNQVPENKVGRSPTNFSQFQGPGANARFLGERDQLAAAPSDRLRELAWRTAIAIDEYERVNRALGADPAMNEASMTAYRQAL
jgi:hypothetical protein